MTIHREDLLAVFPHLDWVIHERQPYRDEYYDSAEAAVLPGEDHERGYISLIVYSSGEMHAELQATYSDHVGCASYPPRSGEPTVIGTLESLRDQIAWRHRLFGTALGLPTESNQSA